MKRTPLRRVVMLTCERCGAEFPRRAEQKSRDREAGVYCLPCSYKVRSARTRETNRTGKPRKCKRCGKEFYRSPRKLGSGYCSVSCASLDRDWSTMSTAFMRANDNRGARNGRYKDGKRVGQHVNKPKVRAEVIARDGDGCLLCNRPGPGLHLHRVIYGSQGGKYEVGNCVQLCLDHHAEVHSDKRRWLPVLLAHLGRN